MTWYMGNIGRWRIKYNGEQMLGALIFSYDFKLLEGDTEGGGGKFDDIVIVDFM